LATSSITSIFSLRVDFSIWPLNEWFGFLNYSNQDDGESVFWGNPVDKQSEHSYFFRNISSGGNHWTQDYLQQG
jgi:hypothetical protein